MLVTFPVISGFIQSDRVLTGSKMKYSVKTPTVTCKRRRGKTFNIIAKLFGLNLGEDSKSGIFPRLYFIAHIVGLAVTVYSTLIFVLKLDKFRANLANIVGYFQLISGSVIAFVAMRNFLYRRPELRKLLLAGFEGEGQSRLQTFAFVLLSLPILVMYSALTAETCLSNAHLGCVDAVLHIYRIISRNYLIWIYLEVLAIVECRCRHLLAALSDRTLRSSDLVDQKWEIRDLISTLNSLFSFPLVFIYSQISIGSVILFVHCVTGIRPVQTTLFAGCQLCLGYITNSMARKCSNIMALLIEVERRLLRGLHEVEFCSEYPQLQWRVLHFDEKWDAPHIGCFVLNQRTFMSFLATSFTCLAVVLQFDFKVVWVVNELAGKFGKGPLFAKS